MIRTPYKLFGKHQNITEEIDATCGENDAKHLINEYKKTYSDWQIWAEDKNGNRLDA